MKNFLNKFSNTNNLAKTICLSIIFYIVLLIIAVLIALILTSMYETKSADIPSVISNMFVWSATLITPVIAILLINSWKSQKSYETGKEYASLILNDLHPIFIGLMEIQNFVINIKTVDENLVLFEKFLTPIDINLYKEALKSYSNIKIYSEIVDNIAILNKHSRLEHHCIFIMNIYEHLIYDSYKKYYNDVVGRYPEYIRNKKKPDFCKRYPESAGYFGRSISRIKLILNRSVSIKVTEPETNKVINYGQYDSLESALKATRELLEDIQREALKSIKVNQ